MSERADSVFDIQLVARIAALETDNGKLREVIRLANVVVENAARSQPTDTETLMYLRDAINRIQDSNP